MTLDLRLLLQYYKPTVKTDVCIVAQRNQEENKKLELINVKWLNKNPNDKSKKS